MTLTEFMALRAEQCDQIGRFIGLWSTLLSQWQQLVCPNLPHSLAIFLNFSNENHFWATFALHLATFYRSHWC